MRLFVYGTLMEGECNSHWLQPARWLRVASTTPNFLLLDMGGYPALVAGGVQAIVGELYDVDEPLITRLDRLEEHPDVYKRTLIALACGTDAIAYVLQPRWTSNGAIIHAADWRTYRKKRYSSNIPYRGECWDDI
ncbi:MAG: gamma-glutamylcyclotransferase [Deltaproteobacteria bacterium]|nr:MAG: gamma-glutamylcyclotransferase [Deltaproteobacteria bacterium]